MAAPLPSWVQAQEPFNAGWSAKYQQLLSNDKINCEMATAYGYVQSLSMMKPAGITVAIRPLAEVKKLLTADNPEGVMFSGALTELILAERAVSAIDAGRMAYILDAATTPAALKNLMGPIIVDVDRGTQGFKRANQDAEVDSLCLLMHWNKGSPDHKKVLDAIAADLTFQGRHMKTGSKTFAEMITADERKQETMGVSSWRKCIFLSEAEQKAQPAAVDGGQAQPGEADDGQQETDRGEVVHDTSDLEPLPLADGPPPGPPGDEEKFHELD